MNKDKVIKYIKYLIAHIEGCPNQNCYRCKKHKENIKELANELSIDVNVLMPDWLKQK